MKRTMLLLALCLLYAEGAEVYAKGTDAVVEKELYQLGPRLKRILIVRPAHDLVNIATTPMRMDRRDSMQLLLFSGLTAGLMLGVDNPMDEEYGSEKSDFPLGLPRVVRGIGDSYNKVGAAWFAAAASVSTIGVGLAVGDRKLTRTGALMYEAFLFAKGITILTKRLAGRSRPFAERGTRDFNLHVSNKRESESFPSGHSSTIFAMATVVSRQYQSWWVGIPAYTLAASVTFQRIESRSHWLSDVVVGAALGHFVGRTLIRRHGTNRSSRVEVMPQAGSGGMGAVLSLKL